MTGTGSATESTSATSPQPARLRCQLRWWRPGGFRVPWLARMTGGRLGLGRWTAQEVADIRRRAAADYHAFQGAIDYPHSTKSP